MDMNRIEAAIEAYESVLSESERDRVSFFKGLLDIQDRHARFVAEKQAYTIPSKTAAETWYWSDKPFFLMKPVDIEADAFVAALEDCSCYLIDHAGLDPQVAEGLRFFDWRAWVAASELGQAGSDPSAYIEAASAAEEGAGAVPAETIALVAAFALRPMLEQAASDTMASLDLKEGNMSHRKPLACPACGSAASAAFVGDTPSSSGKGRMLYCPICGTNWEFERIRCARCGTQNQSHLHYFHVEGDPAHRLHLCDECGDYTRTVFQDDLRAPLAFEVEDVVMATLDAVAHDARFNSERK